jgi:hypothetical protein
MENSKQCFEGTKIIEVQHLFCFTTSSPAKQGYIMEHERKTDIGKSQI